MTKAQITKLLKIEPRGNKAYSGKRGVERNRPCERERRRQNPTILATPTLSGSCSRNENK